MTAPPRHFVTADVVCLTIAGGDPAVLLVRRRNDPFRGTWALPGGFVEENETLAQAAARELEEETGVSCAALEQLAAFGDPGRDPRGRVITVAFLALVPDPAVRAGSDAADARFFPTNALPPLAFDHLRILEAAAAHVRSAAATPARLRRLLGDSPPDAEAEGILRAIRVSSSSAS